MNKVKLAIILLLFLIGSGCSPISIPTEILSVTPAPTVSHFRGTITAEDTKNVEPPILLSLDPQGNLSGFPEETTEDVREEASLQYTAIQKKFPTSNVFYAHDPASGQWLLYSTMGGNLYSHIVSYDNGATEQYDDYPIAYTQQADGSYTVVGEYSLVEIPGALAVIWKNGLPQFLSVKHKLANGDTYYAKYLEYLTLAGEDPFIDLNEVVQMVSSEAPEVVPGTVSLDPEYDLDGKVEINEANSEAFYSYFADAFYRINKDYFANLGVINSADAEKYMEENILPAGFLFPNKVNYSVDMYLKFLQSTNTADMRQIEVRVVNYDQYLSGPEQYGKKYLVSAYFMMNISIEKDPTDAILVGLLLDGKGENGNQKLVLELVQANETIGSMYGFPGDNENIDLSDIDLLDNYLVSLVYAIRSADYSELTEMMQGSGSAFDAGAIRSRYFNTPGEDRKMFYEFPLYETISFVLKNEPNDLPPPILSLNSK